MKDAEDSKDITIFNTLRRILEFYFNIIGGMKYEECIHKFEAEDRQICHSLISCINDGSHFITEDFYMPYGEEFIRNYLRVFRLIFENMGHISHYEMMMKENC